MLRIGAFVVVCAANLALSGCGNTPIQHSDSRTNESSVNAAAARDAALTALTLIGTPYRFGGATPTGFDCSGLVQYSYSVAGLKVPRDTRQQRDRSAKLDGDASLAPGDLVFFSIGSPGLLHVGLFVGNGEFVHAPARGGSVRIERLGSRYWQRHFLEARRL